MLKILAAVAALGLPAAALAQTPTPEPVQVMVLAVPHLDNPGQDVHNATIDPVTTPEKQAQLARVAEDLARFRPTAIAIERVAADPSTMVDPQFADYRPDWLLSRADERVQIGYRLAELAGVERVYAVDEKDREGQPSYFPYGAVVAWAGANGRSGDLQAWGGEVQAFLAEMERRQRTETLGRLLAQVNAPGVAMSTANAPMYYRFLSFGSGEEMPGAELNGRWYTRNAMIFARLMQVAEPGDRIVLMFGAGHAYWLRHFVSTTPGYVLVEPTDYLTEG
ncbi:DUF5694 domain-containing protein [Brevundimonas sp.]|uniref:DUF5694 domain-containing protein n=1 Tax=Brevundimonas sp. TaxID=1871086 RepID=UPI002D5E9837|nr:DUF5694 domain-containing protein [Brevundimonas sp.]HYC73228.1 DUF5694 domain-containing protein [Brevundimonas sp.]